MKVENFIRLKIKSESWLKKIYYHQKIKFTLKKFDRLILADWGKNTFRFYDWFWEG